MERSAVVVAVLLGMGCAAQQGARSEGACVGEHDAARSAAAAHYLAEAQRLGESDPWGALERYLTIEAECGAYPHAGEVRSGIGSVIERAWQARVVGELGVAGKAPFGAIKRGEWLVAALTDQALASTYRQRLAEARATARARHLELAAKYQGFRLAAHLQAQLAARVEEKLAPIDLAPLEAIARGPGWKVEVRAPPACRAVADALSGSLPRGGARICRLELLECGGALSDRQARQEVPCPKEAQPAGKPCSEDRVVKAYVVNVTARIDGVALTQASDVAPSGAGGAGTPKQAIAALAPQLAAQIARAVERRIEHEAQVPPPVGNNDKDLTEAARDDHYLRLLLAGRTTRTPEDWDALQRQIEGHFRARHGIEDLAELRGIVSGAGPIPKPAPPRFTPPPPRGP